jgi:hypothetical protein
MSYRIASRVYNMNDLNVLLIIMFVMLLWVCCEVQVGSSSYIGTESGSFDINVF